MAGAGQGAAASAGVAPRVAMPVFNGAAEVIELVRMLYRRPRIGELPSREQGGRGRRARRGLPMLCLIRPAGTEVLGALSGYLADTGQGRVPHALLMFAAAEPAMAQQPPADAEEFQAVRSILFDLARELGSGRNARPGRIRFRRFGLANWLLQQDVREAGLEPDRVLLRSLRERSLAQRRFPGVGQEIQTELGNVPAPWWVRPLLPFLRRIPPLWFAWKASGRLPVFGAEYRWFMRQPYLAPRDPGTFVGFAERLTVGLRDEEDTTQILKLLVNAFLEDLRRAYRRLPCRPRGARRTTYVVALLDGIRRDNHGYRILKLVNDVRNETGAFDPLLLISGSQKLPPEALDPDSRPALHNVWTADRARRGYQAWCNALAVASRARTTTAWYLPIRVSAVHPRPDPVDGPAGLDDPAESRYVVEKQELAATAPFTIDDPPVWARRAVLYPLLVALLLVAAGIAYAESTQRIAVRAHDELYYKQQHCQQLPSQGADLLRFVSEPHRECIGISDGSYSFFPEDPKLTRVMEKIKEQNDEVLASGRRYVTLVYFSGLGAASAPEGLVAQREALAGVAAKQRHQLNGSDILVRILIANGGAQMIHGERVAEMLTDLAARDSRIVGVVGLGQSRQPTIDTIKALHAAGLPMVASALTADAVVAASSMYHQVSPQNKREASVAAYYAVEELMPQRPFGRQVRIVQSNDGTDTYSSNLAKDVADAFAKPGVANANVEKPWYYRPDTVPPRQDQLSEEALPPSDVGKAMCGFGGLVFYAGRTQEFDSFLRGIEEQCPAGPPAILAGDDISRYAADPEKRGRHRVPFRYLSLAVGQSSCAGSSALSVTMRELFPEDCEGGSDPTLDGHAALAYDATRVMIAAVQHLDDYDVRNIAPAAVWRGISHVSFMGETGWIEFGVGQVPVDKAISILQVSDSRTPKPLASCGRLSESEQASWCPPG